MPPTQAAIPVASEGLAPPAPTRIQLEAEYSQEPEPGRQEQVSKAWDTQLSVFLSKVLKN